MTLVDVIKSDKPFKRKEHKYWLKVTEDGSNLTFAAYEKDAAFNTFHLLISDILATDWEIEEQKIEVTKERVEKAMRKFNVEITDNMNDKIRYTVTLNEKEFLKELGFKE